MFRPARPRLLLAAALVGVCRLSTAAEIPEPAPSPRTAKASPAQLDRLVVDEVVARGEVMSNLQHLADVFGPRVTGSRNLARAGEWAAERMKAYGLENVRQEPWEIPVGWERGTVHLKLVEPDNGRTLTAASRAWTPGTNGRVVGDVVPLRATQKKDLDQYRGKLKNAVVLPAPPATVAPVTDLRYGPPPVPKPAEPKQPDPKAVGAVADARAVPARPAADTPKGDTPPARPPFIDRNFLRDLSEFLKAEGAAAVLLDSAKPHGLLVTTGAWKEGDRGSQSDGLPTLYATHEHYSMLWRLANRPLSARTRVEIEVTNRFVPGPITVVNTVGEIRGSDHPDEFVVLGAHLDSWDLASGATDNGTGSCVVLEAARTLAALAAKGHRPKRTVRFVLFTGEEQGLHGSKQYVKRHAAEMPKTSMCLVHDTGTGKVTGIPLQGRAAVQAVLEPQLASLKDLGFEGLTLGGMGGTDHLPFEAAGVPGFACKLDMDEYRLTHHTQSDTFDKVKEPGLVQSAQVMAVTALRVANLPALLPRNK